MSQEAGMSAMTRSLTVVLAWLAAALLVAVAHARLDRLSMPGSAAAVIGSILVMAYVYMRVWTRHADMTHALAVGIAWLALAIAAEVVVTSRLGHGWFALLGSPAHPLLRSVFLFVWVFAPALFARGGQPAESSRLRRFQDAGR
jgi:hypothetical protein